LSLLSITFPHGDAGLPALYLGDELWAESSPIIIGARGQRCEAGAPTGPTETGSGADILGPYNWTETPYFACDTSIVARVAVYSAVPAATFTVSFPAGATSTNFAPNTTSSSLAPIAAFPSFPGDALWPGQHNFAWAGGQLGFSAAATISRQTFAGQTGNVPSPFFFTDVSNSSNLTLIVAPLDHAHGWACNALAPASAARLDEGAAATRQGSAGRAAAPAAATPAVPWGCGVMNTVASLPAGFTATTLLFGGVGVTATMGAWGDALRRYYNTSRLPDLQTSKLGIYTDNGAFYNNGARSVPCGA
jgi:hypothetical protein